MLPKLMVGPLGEVFAQTPMDSPEAPVVDPKPNWPETNTLWPAVIVMGAVRARG
jgi:hypothetical protein